MPFSYANPTSGPSAGGIGWFDFENLTITPGDDPISYSGTLNDGTIVNFDLTATLISGTPFSFSATPVPTYPGAAFGVVGYTGIPGTPPLDSALTTAPGSVALNFTNITLTNPDSTPVTNYTVVVADAETTGLTEQWVWNTNGGPWQLLTLLSGPPQILTGLGTATATITGTITSFGAYVLTTQSPTSVILTDVAPALSREAIAIGFATTRVRLQKNIAGRIDPADQFQLDITGTPSSTATTTGASTGIQTAIANISAIPGNTYTINEIMAPGSVSALGDYTTVVSAGNATPAGSIPPTGNLPINFTPALGDDVTYTILNVAPETFTKTVDKAFADVGEILTYTVVVDNPNNFTVNNVLVTDATPAGTTYVGNLAVSAPFTGTDPATGITITTIGPDSSVTLSWQVQVNSVPPVPTPIPNVANVTVPGGTSGVTNVATTQVNTAFVTINKMTDKIFAKTGDILTYTLMLNNAGNVPATNVVITDAIPAGTTFVPGSVTGATGTPPALTLAGPIAAGGTATVTFQVQVNNSIPNPNPLPNTASAAFNYTVDPANPNAATGTAESNTVNTQINFADVATTKTVDKAFANTGDVLTYTLVLQNNGNVPADNVIITDAVPAGTTYVSGSVTGATGTPPTLTLANPIVAGGSATVTFQVLVGTTLPVPNPVSNTASAAFTFTVDPEQPDGARGTSTSNAANTQINNASIATTKTVDKAFADTGDVLTYTLFLQNTGNVAANNVVITDAIPAGTTYVTGSLIGAAGAPPLLTLANPLPAGGNTTVTFQVLVDAAVPVPNPLNNSATTAFTFTVDPAVPDGESGTGDSTIATTQINNAAITTTKTSDKAYADVGDVITYTIALQNTGNVAANNVVLTDAIPAGTTFVPGSLTGATGTPPTLTLTSPVPAGGISTITYQVQVQNTVPGTNPVLNTANAAFTYTVDPADPNGASAVSNNGTTSTQVNHAKLSIIKSADKSISYLGDTITYQLAVTNSGNVPANNVVITDTIVAGTNYIAGSLIVSVPATGTPPSGIVITNPIAPGQTISITFKALVTNMPLPNPVVNKASVTYSYTIDPAAPDGVAASASSNLVDTLVFRYNFSQQITDLIESVALEEAALAAIANSEGAKIQKIVAMGGVTTQELLCLNKSVSDMMESISLLEAILKQKMNAVDCQINGTC